MSDAVLFGIIFAGFFVLRFIAATVAFYFLIPAGDRCPNCDAPTVRVQSKVWNAIFPWIRTSWCYNCGWEGFLRKGELSSPAETKALTRKP